MSHISLGISRPKLYPEGYFVANYYQDGQSRKSKTVSLAIHSAEIAFEIVDLWAEDLAKEKKIPYQKVSFKILCERLDNAKKGTPIVGTRNGSVVSKAKAPSSNLGHIKYFKMEMCRAFKEFGADKIRQVMKEGTKILGELQREKIKIERNSGKAKASIAQAMYHTWVETSVDTSIWCTDEEIVAEFQRLKKVNEQTSLD